MSPRAKSNKNTSTSILCINFLFYVLIIAFIMGVQVSFAQNFTNVAIDGAGNAGSATAVSGAKDGGFAWGDINQDGCLDLVVNTNSTTRILISDCALPTPSFTDVTSSLCSGCLDNKTERTALLADINRDGYIDMLRNTAKRLEVYLNNGPANNYAFGVLPAQTPNFQLLTSSTSNPSVADIPDGMNTEGICFADYNNSGWLDIIIENHNYGIDVYENPQDGTANYIYVPPTTTGLISSAADGDYSAAVDFDNDGDVDIIARKRNNSDFFVNSGQASFSAGVDIDNAQNSEKGAVAFADFDNDGDFDLFWTDAGINQIWLQDGIGAGTYSPTSTNSQNGEPWASAGMSAPTSGIDGCAVGDVNNDGKMDLFVTADAGASYLFLNNTPNGGTLSFTHNNLGINVDGDGEGCGFADYDNDGDLDLYVNRNNKVNQLWRNDLNNDNYLYIDARLDLDAGNWNTAVGANVAIIDCEGNIIGGIRDVPTGAGHGTDAPDKVHFGIPAGPDSIYIVEVYYLNRNGSRSIIRRAVRPSTLTGHTVVVYDTDITDVISCPLPPVAVGDIGHTYAGMPFDGDLLANDYDLNGDSIFVATTPITTPSNGTLTINPDGTFVYEPNPAFIGNDQFIYQICDESGLCDTALVTISVTNVPDSLLNDVPIASDDYVTVYQPDTIQGNVLSNDSDPDGDPLIVNTTPVTPPTNGTLTLNPDGTFTYIPNPGFSGTDSFDYIVCEDTPNGGCDTATVTINVIPDNFWSNNPPMAGDDFFLILGGNSIIGNVLTNDNDHDGDNLIVNTTPVVAPQHGTVSINPDGTFLYTPGPTFNGQDAFVYEICDDGAPALCTSATVYISGDPLNTPPIAINDINTTLMHVPVNGNVLTNDISLDGDSIVVSPTILVNPSNGILVWNGDGTYTYIPSHFFSGTDVFTYVICDNGSSTNCDTATVTIHVIEPTGNNNAPVANDDATITLIDQPVTGSLLTNDNDPDGDDLTINTTPTTNPTNGTVTINPDGTYTYIPNPGFTGDDSFSYTVCDNGTPSLCDVATVTISIVDDNNGTQNNPPFAGDDAFMTGVNTPVTSYLLSNDGDLNGDSITINTTPIVAPANGSVVINPDGTFTYTPDNGYTGPDQFVYEICDDANPALCAQATVYLTVFPVNQAPVAVNDINNTLMGTPVTGNVLTNDTDADGNTLTVNTTPLTNPTNGTVVLNPNGTYTYIPDPSFVGTDSFQYVICDNGTPASLCDTAWVTVQVIDPNTGANNNPPVANNDANATLVDVPVSGSLGTNDFDWDGDNLVFDTNPVTNPSNGSVFINPDGTYTYFPNPGFTGDDTFSYLVCDNGTPSLCDTATVTVSVHPDNNGTDNNPPFAGDDAAATTMDVPVSGSVLPNDNDPNGDNLVINTNPIANPTNGSVVINPDGTFTYTPNPGFIGNDQFVYEICDDATPALCAQATVYLTVFPQVGGNSTFPVEWLRFDAELDGRDGIISWATATELNSDFFVLERSIDATIFETVAEIDAAGNSTEVRSYEFTDENVVTINSGRVYYRLKQVDFDGSYSYSNMVELYIGSSDYALNLNVYPNPTTDVATIDVSAAADANVEVRILNTAGKLMWNSVNANHNGEFSHTLNVSDWAKGVYFVQLLDEQGSRTTKLIVE